MEVKLLAIFIISVIILCAMIIFILFKPEMKIKQSLTFFKNENFQKVFFFVFVSILIFIINSSIIESLPLYFGHVIAMTIILFIFRKGIVSK